jgi:hypothetical protein
MPVRRAMIDVLCDDLMQLFGRSKTTIPESDLRRFYEEKSYRKMAYAIAETIKLKLNLRIGYINDTDKPKNFSQLKMPRRFPLYNTAAYKETTVTLYFYKEFYQLLPFDAVVSLLAGNLTCFLLYGINNKHKDQSEAGEIGAMILGYAEYYRKYLPCVPTLDDSRIISGCMEKIARELSQHGHEAVVEGTPALLREEVEYALSLLTASQRLN